MSSCSVEDTATSNSLKDVNALRIHVKLCNYWYVSFPLLC